MKLLAFAATAFATGVLGAGEALVDLTADNFNAKVVKDEDSTWFIKFYAPWCGHCKAITEVWKDLADELKGKVKVGEVDVTKNEDLAKEYGVATLPTIKLLKKGKKSASKAIAHDGSRDLESFTDFALQHAGMGKKKEKAKLVKPELRGNGENVELTDDNFDEKVMKDEKGIWFVKFYAPWCGHCKNVAPIWVDFAAEMKGKINVAELDVTKNEKSAARFGANMLPTIKIFPAGKKSPSNAVAHEGERTLNGFSDFAAKYIEGVEEQTDKVVELTNDNFDRKVMRDENSIWFVKFYAPWCGHCKSMIPAWEQLARDFEGKVKVGKMDATVHVEKSSRYGVQSFPTIKIFPKGQKSENGAIDYDGARDVAALKKKAEEILATGEKVAAALADPSKSRVLELTEANFDDVLMKDTENMYAVLFHASWCPHCKAVMPSWEQLALEAEDGLKVAKVDVPENKIFEERFDAKGFPQFRFFPKGKKFDNKAITYNGEREIGSYRAKIREMSEDGVNDVVTLTDSIFSKKVFNSDKPWMVKFYAPWCSHCKAVAGAWDELGTSLKGKVNVGKLDVTLNNNSAHAAEVKILPTIKYFPKGQTDFGSEKLYGAERSKEELEKWALAEGKVTRGAEEAGDAKVLTDDTFTKSVLGDDKNAWFVEFYAPWCGHCKALKPVWDELARNMKGQNVEVGKVDCTSETNTCGLFDVNSFPSLYFFPKGAKTQASGQLYNGNRDLASLTEKCTGKSEL